MLAPTRRRDHRQPTHRWHGRAAQIGLAACAMVTVTAVVPRLCAGCGVPLSRYNRQSVCSACARSARGVDDPDDGMGTSELAIGVQVAQLRHQAG